MKRADVRLAWREKLAIFSLIMLLNGIVVFYIIEFGRLLCPNFDKAWKANEVAQHTGEDDFWVAVQGQVYDVSNFVRGDHSDITGISSNGADALEVLAGQDLTYYFPPPLILGCPGLVTDGNQALLYANFTADIPQAVHTSGALQSTQNTKLDDSDWYTNTFQKKMKDFHKGPLVWDKKEIWSQSHDDTSPRYDFDLTPVVARVLTYSTRNLGIWNNAVYDLTDYVYTVTTRQNQAADVFLDSDISDLFKQRAGQDISKPLEKVLAAMDSTKRDQNVNCLNNIFYRGQTDFRTTARCQAQGWVLVAASAVLMSSMVLKCE